MKLFKYITRWLTKWAWIEEIAVSEGITVLKKLQMESGKLDLELEIDPVCQQAVARCFASMVASSPNYTEMQFGLRDNSKYEWITVTVKKGNGKTPHALRMEAEEKLQKYKDQVEGSRTLR